MRKNISYKTQRFTVSLKRKMPRFINTKIHIKTSFKFRISTLNQCFIQIFILVALRGNGHKTLSYSFFLQLTISTDSYRLYMPQSDSRGSATPRKRSVTTMDAQSIRSVETQAPPPTSPDDNKKLTK